MLTLHVPGPLRNPLNGSHGHWSKHHRWAKSWRERTAQRLLLHKLTTPADAAFFRTPTTPKRITLIACTVRRFDPDALPAICKPILDGLVDAQIVDRDDASSTHTIRYEQRIAPQHRGVEIIVKRAPCPQQ
jgi:hypothetical protein